MHTAVQAPEGAPKPHHVHSFQDWCELANVSLATGKRLVAAGKGPRITRLSERRIGVQHQHHLAWLEERAA
jgi:hypothetical protein